MRLILTPRVQASEAAQRRSSGRRIPFILLVSLNKKFDLEPD